MLLSESVSLAFTTTRPFQAVSKFVHNWKLKHMPRGNKLALLSQASASLSLVSSGILSSAVARLRELIEELEQGVLDYSTDFATQYLNAHQDEISKVSNETKDPGFQRQIGFIESAKNLITRFVSLEQKRIKRGRVSESTLSRVHQGERSSSKLFYFLNYYLNNATKERKAVHKSLAGYNTVFGLDGFDQCYIQESLVASNEELSYLQNQVQGSFSQAGSEIHFQTLIDELIANKKYLNSFYYGYLDYLRLRAEKGYSQLEGLPSEKVFQSAIVFFQTYQQDLLRELKAHADRTGIGTGLIDLMQEETAALEVAFRLGKFDVPESERVFLRAIFAVMTSILSLRADDFTDLKQYKAAIVERIYNQMRVAPLYRDPGERMAAAKAKSLFLKLAQYLDQTNNGLDSSTARSVYLQELNSGTIPDWVKTVMVGWLDYQVIKSFDQQA